MRNRFKILILTLITLSTSCKKGFQDLNNNPNAITSETIEAELLFPRSVIKTFDSYNVGINTELWALMTWTQMVASSNAVSINEEFQYGGSDVDLIWNVLYTESLSNINEVITLTNDNPEDVNKNAVARIWKVYLFHIITDLWGDAPYFDALKGNTEEKNLYPKYDKQELIYEDLIKELTTAVSQMDNSKEILSTDIIYSGDLNLWTKFANTLKLRLAIRISDANPSLAQNTITELITDNNFISNSSEEAVFQYSYGDNVRSPIAEGFRQSQVSELPSQLFVNKMLADNDPRLPFMIDSTKESKITNIFGPFIGTKNFSSDKQDSYYRSNFSNIYTGGDGFESPEGRLIISYEESCLLQSEAALLGYGGDVNTLLTEGINSHMSNLSVPDSLISDYINNLPIATLELIATEKWKILFMRDGFEAYAEWRRTGYPLVIDEKGEILNQALVPTKLPYPNSEISRNDNINDIGISPTDMYSKVWWDKN